jgi:hypothetical protein
MKMKRERGEDAHRLDVFGPLSERAIFVPALARDLYFFFPGIATGLAAVFLIVGNYTATGFVCAPFWFVFSHSLLLHPDLRLASSSILTLRFNTDNWKE